MEEEEGGGDEEVGLRKKKQEEEEEKQERMGRIRAKRAAALTQLSDGLGGIEAHW